MSQLYARIFLQILDSSLADDWQTRHVFEDLLKLSSSEGVVDMTHAAISRRTNVPLDIVERAISSLEAPDLISRDPQEGGRRIVRLDAHRTWGWRIVNFDRYESIRKQQDVREAERVKKAASRARSSPCTPSEEDPTTATATATEGPRHVATCPGHVRDNQNRNGASTDQEWVNALKTRKAYEGIDVEREMDKCLVWCEAKGATFNKRRLINWLNRIDKPLLTAKGHKLSADEILGLKTQIRSLRGYNTSDPKERAGYESQAVALIAKLAASGEVYP